MKSGKICRAFWRCSTEVGTSPEWKAFWERSNSLRALEGMRIWLTGTGLAAWDGEGAGLDSRRERMGAKGSVASREVRLASVVPGSAAGFRPDCAWRFEARENA